MLVIIPMWNTVIKIAENWFDTCNEGNNCCTWNCKCMDDSNESCYNRMKDFYNKNKRKLDSFFMDCVWLAVLFYELAFWGLFIVILFNISRFLLGSIKVQDLDHPIKLAFSYIVIAAVSGILAWLNTDLVTIGQQNNDGKKEHQQDKEENQDEQQSYQENQDEQQKNNDEIKVEVEIHL